MRLELRKINVLTNTHRQLLFWLLLLLLLTRFDLLGAGLTVLLVLAQTFVGTTILLVLKSLDRLPALSRVGLGFCLGATLMTISYVIVLTYTGLILAIFSQFTLLIFSYFVWRIQPKQNLVEERIEEPKEVKWLAVAALFGLAPEWFWTLYVAIFLTILFLGHKFFASKSLFFRVIVLALYSLSGLFCWIRVLGARPSRPWFPDDSFAEVWSFSIGKWGLSHNPMLMGESISYHWFSFAWTGLASKLTFMQVTEFLPLFAPIVVAFVCSILSFQVINSVLKNSVITIYVLIAFFLFDTEKVFRGFGFHAFQANSFSQFFSLLFGLSCLLMVATMQDRSQSSNFILFSIILFGAIGSKSSTGLVLAFGLLSMSLFQIFTEPTKRIKILGFGSIVLSVTFISGLFFYGNPMDGSPSVIRRPGWLAGSDLDQIYNGPFIKYLPILFFSILSLGGIGFLTLFNVHFLKHKQNKDTKIMWFISGAYVISLAQMCVAQGDGAGIVSGTDNTLYAFQLITVLSLLFGLASAINFGLSAFSRKILIQWASLILLLSLVMTAVARNFDVNVSDQFFTPLWTSLRPSLPFLVILLASALICGCVTDLRSQGSLNVFLLYAFGSLVFVGLIISGLNFTSKVNNQQTEWRNKDLQSTVTSDYGAAVFWLTKNAEPYQILASNFRQHPVSMMSGFREFVGFPDTVRLAGLHSSNESARRKAFEGFIRSGSCASVKLMRQSGVDFFLIDLSSAKANFVERCAEEVYRNPAVVIYSFNLELIN